MDLRNLTIFSTYNRGQLSVNKLLKFKWIEKIENN